MRPGTRDRRLEITDQRPEARDRRQTRNRRPEIRDRRRETRDQRLGTGGGGPWDRELGTVTGPGGRDHILPIIERTPVRMVTTTPEANSLRMQPIEA